MATATAQRLQFLYLIASGNQDNVYKIGISDSPQRRLEQIQRDYGVPKAYIVEFMDVPTRDEVFAIENALHLKFDRCQSRKYPGKEWFKLNDKDLKELRTLYQENSDSFAQARAYYGIVQEIARTKEAAEKEEFDRQVQITHNRIHGKTYDTTPKGILKRHRALIKKTQEGVLADRFAFRRIEHPVVKAMSEGRKEVVEIIKKKVKGTALQVGAIGLLSGMILGGAMAPKSAGQIATGTTIFGLIAGAVSGLKRETTEIENLRVSMNTWVDHEYPNTRTQTMEFIEDRVDHKSLLVRDYTETQSLLRKQPARMPKIDLSTTIIKPMKDRYQNKSYFPKVASVLTIGCSLFIGGGYADDEKNGRYSFEATPVPIERLA